MVKNTDFRTMTSLTSSPALPHNSVSSCTSFSPFIKCWDYYLYPPHRDVRIIRVSMRKTIGTVSDNIVSVH